MVENNIVIGEIEFLSPLSEAEVIAKKDKLNFGGKIGACKVEVFNNEGTIPHFHISNKEKTIDCCVCIFSNNFFAHGSHNGHLNKGQCKELDKWLRSQNKNGGTNWEFIRDSWLANNTVIDSKTMNKNSTQPNYYEITTFVSL